MEHSRAKANPKTMGIPTKRTRQLPEFCQNKELEALWELSLVLREIAEA